ncbi:Zinc finger BED domain-containing protein RICESLEEPER 2 [Linum grandiflorum]
MATENHKRKRGRSTPSFASRSTVPLDPLTEAHQESNDVPFTVGSNDVNSDGGTNSDGEEVQVPVKKKKFSGIRAKIWEEYIVTYVEEGKPKTMVRKGKCNLCSTLIAADGKKNGTSTLKNHHAVCKRKFDENNGQTLLKVQPAGDRGAKLTVWKFDQHEARLALAEMIILDEHPFKFVEKEGFKKFMLVCCPMFKIPGRKTIREDCIKLFLERKDNMKCLFQGKGLGRVSITADCWTSTKNMCFICVTANFIINDWKLNKKIISFSKIASHKGDDIVRYLKEKLVTWETYILDGKYLHVRCVAHIINLVVTEGLREIGIFFRRVRECLKWGNSSPAREESFNVAVSAKQIKCTKKLCMDAPTRWNSTYLMLQSAVPYETAIDFLPRINPSYEVEMNQKMYEDEELKQKVPMGPATLEDFLKVKKMVEYLHRFYILTNLVSGISYVTSHLFFKEMCDLLDTIAGFENNEELEIRLMGARMKSNVGKCWMEEKELNPKLNKILYIAAILDPRQKVKHVEKCLKKVYGLSKAIVLVKEIKEQFVAIFEEYKKMIVPPTPSSTSNSISRTTTTEFSSNGYDDNTEIIVRGSCSTFQDDSDDDNAKDEASDMELYLKDKHLAQAVVC